MGDKPVKLGSLTLLLIVVLICLATLSVLAFTTARADLALARKHAQMVQQVYETDAIAQDFLASTDEALAGAQGLSGDAFVKKMQELLPGDAVVEEDHIYAVITGTENRQVTIELSLLDGKYQITRWEPSVIWEPDETMDGLWNGM